MVIVSGCKIWMMIVSQCKVCQIFSYLEWILDGLSCFVIVEGKIEDLIIIFYIYKNYYKNEMFINIK